MLYPVLLEGPAMAIDKLNDENKNSNVIIENLVLIILSTPYSLIGN